MHAARGAIVMCDVHQNLLKEEAQAWFAYKESKDSVGKNQEETLARADRAGLATSRLRTHIRNCSKCNAPDPRWQNHLASQFG
jgi:hypothetical protein